MARKNIAAGNWKMNTDSDEAKNLCSEINEGLKSLDLSDQTQLMIFPPALHLQNLAELSSGTKNLFIGAQNCHQENKGAFTGEISASMIKKAGGTHVILGHSERREYFGEDENLLTNKIKAAHEAGLIAIYCCGEIKEQRENGSYKEIISAQIKNALSNLSIEEAENIVVAYEPVWAIGTGLTASPEQAQEVHALIRQLLAEIWSPEQAEETSILYGGSVKPGNAQELFSQNDIDGGLIGGASLKAADFLAIASSF